MEKWKKEITLSQVRKWLAFYRFEPWGSPWRMAGRMTSLIRASNGAKYDPHDEERFLITYREGDEYRPRVPMTEDEIKAKFEQLARMTDGGHDR